MEEEDDFADTIHAGDNTFKEKYGLSSRSSYILYRPKLINNMYVCIFIKLHITTQSGPVIYSLYATACDPPGGYL